MSINLPIASNGAVYSNAVTPPNLPSLLNVVLTDEENNVFTLPQGNVILKFHYDLTKTVYFRFGEDPITSAQLQPDAEDSGFMMVNPTEIFAGENDITLNVFTPDTGVTISTELRATSGVIDATKYTTFNGGVITDEALDPYTTE